MEGPTLLSADNDECRSMQGYEEHDEYDYGWGDHDSGHGYEEEVVKEREVQQDDDELVREVLEILPIEETLAIEALIANKGDHHLVILEFSEDFDAA